MTDETAVRFVEENGNWFLEGMIVPFTGPLPGQRDLYGTKFDEQTDLRMDWFPNGGRPGLYDHGFDPEVGPAVIGHEVASRKVDKGIWMRAQLDKAGAYASEIRQLAEKGALSLSSGTLERLMKINPDTRHVDVWPWVEWSVTTMPGNPEASLYSVRSLSDAISHIETAGTEVPGPILEIIDEKPETNEETPAESPLEVRSITEATIRALVDALNPQALHDAALASGARCAGETEKAEPVLSITASETVTPEDLAAWRSDLTGIAQKAVKERLGL